jgi:hypothetical protein
LKKHPDAFAGQFIGSNTQHLADYLVAIQNGWLGTGAFRNDERGLYSVEREITQCQLFSQLCDLAAAQ